MSGSLHRVLIAHAGDVDPSRLARTLRDAGAEAILLDAPDPDPAHVAAVAVQEDVDEITVLAAAADYLDRVREALTAEDAGDIAVTAGE